MSSIVALTTSYICVLHFCGQVPFLYVIIVGFVAVGQARPSRSTSRCTAWSTEDHGTPHSAHSRSAVLPHAEQLTLQRWRKKRCLHCRALTSLSHAPSFTRTYIRTYVHTYVRTYIHTYLPTVLPSRSFTTSFVFPSFPVPAKTIEAHYWKKLTCGVIRSFN